MTKKKEKIPNPVTTFTMRDIPRGGRGVYRRLNPAPVAYSIRITK